MPSRLWLVLAFVLAFGATPTHAQGAAKRFDVTLDQATVAKVPDGASTLIIGNPMIADVTLLKAGSAMVVTGKSYGQTNLIALDAGGAVLLDEELRVLPASAIVVLQNGTSHISLACNPDCMPTVQLGDDSDVFSKAGAQITTRNALAQGANAGGK